jgi:hypothetical protein
MTSAVLRNAIKLLLAALLALIALCLEVRIVVAHACSIRRTLEVSGGLRAASVREDPLLGPLFLAAGVEATGPQLMAITFAAIEVLGFCVLACCLWDVMALGRFHRASVAAGDSVGARSARFALAWRLLISLLTIGGLVLVVRADLDAWRYAARLGFRTFDEPSSISGILGWPRYVGFLDRLLIVGIGWSGPWGWAVLSGLGWLACVWGTRRTGVRVHLIAHALGRASEVAPAGSGSR